MKKKKEIKGTEVAPGMLAWSSGTRGDPEMEAALRALAELRARHDPFVRDQLDMYDRWERRKVSRANAKSSKKRLSRRK